MKRWRIVCLDVFKNQKPVKFDCEIKSLVKDWPSFFTLVLCSKLTDWVRRKAADRQIFGLFNFDFLRISPNTHFIGNFYISSSFLSFKNETRSLKTFEFFKFFLRNFWFSYFLNFVLATNQKFNLFTVKKRTWRRVRMKTEESEKSAMITVWEHWEHELKRSFVLLF